MYEETFTIPVTPPFRLDFTVWALRRRQKNLIDQWDNGQYRRVLVVHGETVQISVEQSGEVELVVFAKSKSTLSGKQKELTQQVQKILGVERDLEAFYRLADKNTHIQSLAYRFRGVKPPRFPNVFEALINAVACQQVSLDVGIILLNRLSETFGKEFEGQYAFPQPEDFYQTTEEEIQKLGFSHQKAKTILLLAQQVREKSIIVDDLETLPNSEIMNRLVSIHGIGRWSAEYVLLRGLGRIDTFPGDDVGAQRNVMNLIHLDHMPRYAEIQKVTKTWEPYAGFVYFHLLLDKLDKKNLL